MPRNRTLLLVTTLTALALAGVALGDGLVIDLGSPPPLSTLVRFQDRDYAIDYDANVSLTPLSETSVRKIEFGVVTTVNVTTTASGTYSTDGLTSPHIAYPGLTVEEVREDAPDSPLGVFVDVGRYARSGGMVSLFSSADGNFAYLDTGSAGIACHAVGSFTHCFGH